MIRLTREVRFSIDRDWAGRVELSQPKSNSWAGWPSAVGIVPYLCLRATVAGMPDATTGYLCNIKVIDDLLRAHAIPRSADALRQHGWRIPAEQLLREIWDAVRARFPVNAPLERLTLLCTPYLRYSIEHARPAMIYLTQQFEFSAAHRLHCPALSEAQNREIFGKCNNPNGHGHNYFVEVTLAAEPDTKTGMVFPLPKLEEIVNQAVVARLDHKHLNEDSAEFREVNPSVENIARVIWQMLRGRFGSVALDNVRVWETPKTCAEYRGE